MTIYSVARLPFSTLEKFGASYDIYIVGLHLVFEVVHCVVKSRQPGYTFCLFVMSNIILKLFTLLGYLVYCC